MVDDISPNISPLQVYSLFFNCRLFQHCSKGEWLEPVTFAVVEFALKLHPGMKGKWLRHDKETVYGIYKIQRKLQPHYLIDTDHYTCDTPSQI